MPDQALSKRQTGEIVPPQLPIGGAVSRYTQSKLAEVRSVIGAGTVAYDKMYGQMEAYARHSEPSRSPAHQKYLQERMGYLLDVHDMAVQKIVKRAIEDIFDERMRPQVITRTVYVPAPRKSLLEFLTGG